MSTAVGADTSGDTGTDASGDANGHGWTTVCRVDEIPPLGARRVARAAGLPVAVFRTAGDRVFALLDRCPHKAGPLSQGIVHGEHVACPLHGWNIALADGAAVAPDEGCTPRFACRVEAGAVQLDAIELATHAVDLAAPLAGAYAKPAFGTACGAVAGAVTAPASATAPAGA